MTGCLYLCQFPQAFLIQSIIHIQAERSSHFSPDSLLADKYQEHQESSQKVQTINHSKEHLKIAGEVFAGGLAVITMDEIVEEGEGPEDTKDEEQLAIQDLENNYLMNVLHENVVGGGSMISAVH